MRARREDVGTAEAFGRSDMPGQPAMPGHPAASGRPGVRDQSSVRNQAAAPLRLTITCDGIDSNGHFLGRHTGRGEDVSPAVHVAELPTGTATLAMTLRDMSHPLFGSMTHWVVWNVSAVCDVGAEMPHGFAHGSSPIRQGIAYGWHRYRGPKPPRGTTHRYALTVYALDTRLELGRLTARRRLLRAMDGHVLGIGSVDGRYS